MLFLSSKHVFSCKFFVAFSSLFYVVTVYVITGKLSGLPEEKRSELSRARKEDDGWISELPDYCTD